MGDTTVGRRRGLLRSLCTVAVLGVFGIGTIETAGAQEIPQPPPEAVPVLNAVGPTVWTVCNAPNQVLGTIATVQGLVPVPLPANPIDVLALATPVTATFYNACALFPIPPALPKCTADASFSALAMVGLPGPLALAILQAGALEDLVATGQPIASALAAAAGCGPAPTAPALTAPKPAQATSSSAQPSSGPAQSAAAGGGLALGVTPTGGLTSGSELGAVVHQALVPTAALPDAPRRFATWVLSLAILGAAALATAGSVATRRLRQRISTSSR